MEEGHWQNQRTVRGVWSLDENVSCRSRFRSFAGLVKLFVFLEALRILKVTVPEEGETRKGALLAPKIEASRNFWEGSGLKIDSSATDVVWGHGSESFD
jgi:hypothetical protein